MAIDPYIKKDPNDLIRSGDWNDIQVRARQEIRSHTHRGDADGTPIPREGIMPNAIDGTRIDPAAKVTVAQLKVVDRDLLADINTLITRANDFEARITTLTNRANGADGRLTNLESRAGALETTRATRAGGTFTGAVTVAAGQFTVSGGSIVPRVGNAPDTGIYFPTNPGGGGGDEAFIRYFAQGTEVTKLLIGIEDNPEAVGRVTVGDGTTLEELRFTVVPDLIPERILVEGQLADVSAASQLCDAGHGAAQGFPALGAAGLAGVDVVLRPTTPQVVGMLALHLDLKGHPAEAPYGGATVPFTVSVEDSALRKPLWVPVQLPKPVLLKDRWWLVLTVEHGEALWPLATAVPMVEGGLGAVLRRLGQGAWFPWEPPPSVVWALGRLRVSSQAAPPPFQVELQRGAVKRTVTPDASGKVVVPDTVLAALGTAGATVEVAVRSAGPAVMGAVRLGELRVAVR